MSAAARPALRRIRWDRLLNLPHMSVDRRDVQTTRFELAPRIGTTEAELVKTGRLRPVQVSMSDVFKTAAFDRSATPPEQ